MYSSKTVQPFHNTLLFIENVFKYCNKSTCNPLLYTADNHIQNKYKWERDVQREYSVKEWGNLLQNSQTFLTNTKHRMIQFNILHCIYFTPYTVHQLYYNTSYFWK